MKRRAARCSFLSLAAGIGLLTSASTGTAAQAGTDLSGRWMRDPDSSDDAEARIEEAAKGFVDKATKGGRGILSEEIPEIQKSLENIISLYVHHAEEMTIEEQSGELRIDDGYGRIRIFYIDGEKHKRQTPFGADLETICTRQDRQILVDQKLDKWGRITETFVLSSDGEALIHTVRFESKRFKEPLVIRSSYYRMQDGV